MGTTHELPHKNIDRDTAEAALAEGEIEGELLREEYIIHAVKRLENLNRLIELAKMRLTSDDLFQTVIKQTLEATDYYPETLAKELKVSNSTVSRWMNKLASPHPSKKLVFYKQMKRLCSKEIRSLKREMLAF